MSPMSSFTRLAKRVYNAYHTSSREMLQNLIKLSVVVPDNAMLAACQDPSHAELHRRVHDVPKALGVIGLRCMKMSSQNSEAEEPNSFATACRTVLT